MVKITVEYNKTTLPHFFTPTFLVYPYLENQLLTDFIHYKKYGSASILFGRDVQFDFPAKYRDSEVWHIHLDLTGNNFKGERRQFKRTSDDYLVYTFGFSNEFHYSLLGVVTPEAHAKMSGKDTRLLSYFAEQADAFRNSN